MTRVIVIGAGVGGLSTALALGKAGVDVTVFERATDLRRLQVGSGIHLWHNAMRALQVLGADERVASVGEPVERMEWLNSRGDFLAAWRVGDMGRELDAPAIGIVRSDLYEALASLVDPDRLVLGAEFTGFEQDGAGVTVRFADGREERADLLIGADGARSTVRTGLLGPSEPKYAGYTLWHSAVAGGDLVPANLFREIWGPGARFGFYPVRGRTYWFGLVKAPPGGRDEPGRRKAAVLERYRGWPEPTEALIDAASEETIVRADIVGREPDPRWGEGRVTLLGDAAHAMTPNLGQGAAQAIEDAVVLARCLGGALGDEVGALRRYERLRIPRTSSIVRRAWKIGESGLWENPAAIRLRDWIMKLVFPTLAWHMQRKDMTHEL